MSVIEFDATQLPINLQTHTAARMTERAPLFLTKIHSGTRKMQPRHERELFHTQYKRKETTMIEDQGPPPKRLKTTETKEEEFSTHVVAKDAPAEVHADDDGVMLAMMENNNNIGVNLDALTLVMSLLGPRELLRLSVTCKTLRSAVTTTMVVRSALIHGGHSKKTMQELYPLMKKKSIYVPSAHRLLSLATGKRCEACLQGKVNFARPEFGLFLCCGCKAKSTREWKCSWARFHKNHDDYSTVLFHPRVAGFQYGNFPTIKVMMTKYVVGPGGKREGPIVCFGDIDRMVEDGAGVEDYTTRNLDAPMANEYIEFVEAFDGINERATKEGEERLAKREAAKVRNKAKKGQRAHELVDKLKVMLGEDESSLPWRDAATLHYNCTRESKWCGPLVFTSSFVNSLMAPYILHPSKMRKKILTEICDQINAKFRLVEDTAFLTFGFLSSTDPLQSRLKMCAAHDFPTFEALVLTKRVSKDWFALLEENQLVRALALLYDDNFGCALLPPEVYLKYHSMYKSNSFGFPASADNSAQLLLFRRATTIYMSMLRQEFDPEQVTATNNPDGDQGEYLGAAGPKGVEEDVCESSKSPYLRALATSHSLFNRQTGSLLNEADAGTSNDSSSDQILDCHQRTLSVNVGGQKNSGSSSGLP